MKVEGAVFGAISFFLFVTSIVYWYLGHDPTGTTALALACGLAFIVSYYCLYTARRIEPRPEDREEADISDGAGEMGFFAPHSYWPPVIAAGATVFGYGIVYGWWLAAIGMGIIISGGIGLSLEFFVGAGKH